MRPQSQGIKFDLRPMTAKSRQTTRRLTIAVNGEVVWPVKGEPDAPLEIQIDDLLAHLTEFWKPLMLRQVYPIAVNPPRPSDLRRDAARRWDELPSETVQREEDAVAAFEEAHDLARAFAGIFGLQSFWIFRSGDCVMIETAGSLWRLPFEDVRASLSSVGDEICAILLEADVERWNTAVEAWRDRNNSDEVALLAWSAGIDRTFARTLIDEGALVAPANFDDAASDNDELRIAARMAGALPHDQIRDVIKLARQFSKHKAQPLSKLAKACSQHILERYANAKPFVQGEAVARFVRDHHKIPRHQPIDVFEFTKELGVELKVISTEPSTLEGLAIWGKSYGPGAFLNAASSRVGAKDGDASHNAGARITLAHELCHLLLDGGHALSAVEVLMSRMPLAVEQRAKSFAGEFLLPTEDAATAWIEAGRPFERKGVDEVVTDLAATFNVTRSVAAWKIQHGAAREGVELAAILDLVAPWR